MRRLNCLMRYLLIADAKGSGFLTQSGSFASAARWPAADQNHENRDHDDHRDADGAVHPELFWVQADERIADAEGPGPLGEEQCVELGEEGFPSHQCGYRKGSNHDQRQNRPGEQ